VIRVSFACDCPHSHVEAAIARAASPRATTEILFERSGKRILSLEGGTYRIAYRAQGTPATPFSLKATGGAMRAVERVLPSDGRAAGVRTLVVVARLVFAPIAASLLCPAGVVAQDAGSSERRIQTERSLATLPNVSDVLRSGYYLTLEADSDSRTGTATVAVENGAGSFSAALTFSAPLDRTEQEALPLTRSGMAAGGSGRLALHWFHWPNRPDVSAMQRLCQKILQKDDCDDEEIVDPADRRAFIRLAHSGDAPTILNVRAEAGRETFRFVHRADLTNDAETHTSWSLAAGLGRYSPRLGYLAVEYQRQRRFRAGQSSELCESATTTALLRCRTVVLGGPSGQTLDIGSVEWRHFFPGGRFAINPSASRDIRGGVSWIDLPFYFLTLSSGSLAGGATARWRSDTNDIAVALFVGAALSPTQ
jgi:hypothetical protein